MTQVGAEQDKDPQADFSQEGELSPVLCTRGCSCCFTEGLLCCYRSFVPLLGNLERLGSLLLLKEIAMNTAGFKTSMIHEHA